MKRSEINRAIKNAIEMLEANNIRLPMFAYWKLEEWRKNRDILENLRAVALGWDVTDFGSDDFSHTGAVLFTLRNGKADDPRAGTPYAEKLIFIKHETEQALPFHFHKVKTEDIINRGGGVLAIRLYNSRRDGALDEESDIRVKMDGIVRTLPAGAIVEVEKGNSITLHPGLHHRFWAKKGCGDLVAGEVSSVNDDRTDNYFLDAPERFASIVEDQDILYPLCNELESVLG
ncbi:hypothetical protein FACS1894191_1250 [Clostridia bacterium]|nr:hypothetical protein FACS1894191_1250 [Clostridia bacterium]